MKKEQCSLCGGSFECGVDNITECWCVSLPALAPYTGKTGCMCPKCLSVLIKEIAQRAQEEKDIKHMDSRA